MEAIFHEKQEGSLCAQHCLNALLQGSYFTAVDLADIARQLDETERLRMAEAGVHSLEYQHFLQQPSHNFDDSGFFSIQVLQTALRVWNLELVPFQSSDARAREAREEPRSQQAYICNFREHWLAIRKIGFQWFNLNSLLSGVELISDTYLAMFLTQLQHEGYSIFVVVGNLPECEADQLLRIAPAVQTVKPQLLTTDTTQLSGESGSSQGQDFDLQAAMEASRQLADDQDTALKEALARSMQDFPEIPIVSDVTSTQSSSMTTSSTSSAPSSNTPAPSTEEVRNRRQAFLSRLEKIASDTEDIACDTAGEKPAEDSELAQVQEDSGTKEGDERNVSELSEQEMLDAAIKLSMQNT